MEQSWRSRQTPRRHDVSWPYGRKRNVNTERGKRHRRVARTMVRFTGGRSLSDWRGIAAGAGVWPGVRGVVRAGGGAFAACGRSGLAGEWALSDVLFGRTASRVCAVCGGGVGTWRAGFAWTRGTHIDLRRHSRAAGAGFVVVRVFRGARLCAYLRGVRASEHREGRKARSAGGGGVGAADRD